jgi:hypothetical protein
LWLSLLLSLLLLAYIYIYHMYTYFPFYIYIHVYIYIHICMRCHPLKMAMCVDPPLSIVYSPHLAWQTEKIHPRSDQKIIRKPSNIIQMILQHVRMLEVSHPITIQCYHLVIQHSYGRLAYEKRVIFHSYVKNNQRLTWNPMLPSCKQTLMGSVPAFVDHLTYRVSPWVFHVSLSQGTPPVWWRASFWPIRNQAHGDGQIINNNRYFSRILRSFKRIYDELQS